MASAEQVAESQLHVGRNDNKNLPFAAEIRKIIWKYALGGAVVRIPVADNRGRDVKGARADTIPLVLEHVEFDLRFTSTPLVQLQLALAWPSLHHVKHIVIKSEQVAVYSSGPILFPCLEILTFSLAPEGAGSMQPLASALGDASAEIRIYGIFALFRLAVRRHEEVRDRHIGILRHGNSIRASKLSGEPVELRVEVPLASDATLTVKDTSYPAERGWLRGPKGGETIELPSMWTYLVWRMAVPAAELNAAILSTFEAMGLHTQRHMRATTRNWPGSPSIGRISYRVVANDRWCSARYTRVHILAWLDIWYLRVFLTNQLSKCREAGRGKSTCPRIFGPIP